MTVVSCCTSNSTFCDMPRQRNATQRQRNATQRQATQRQATQRNAKRNATQRQAHSLVQRPTMNSTKGRFGEQNRLLYDAARAVSHTKGKAGSRRERSRCFRSLRAVGARAISFQPLQLRGTINKPLPARTKRSTSNSWLSINSTSTSPQQPD